MPAAFPERNTMLADSALMMPSDTRTADRLAIAAGVPIETLMRRAGTAVADAVGRRCAVGARISILCGPGANGGDGFAAAQILRRRGFRVEIGCTVDRDVLTGAAAVMARDWQDPVLPVEALDLGGTSLIVDALFGAGLSRPLEGSAAVLVQRINAAGVPVLAVDVPSGIDGGTGLVRGHAVRANETVAFERRRPGHLLLPGREHAGTVRTVGIGLPDTALAGLSCETFANGPALWGEHWPMLDLDTHKYRRGAVLVLSGGVEGCGASRLVARAALRIGAGLVILAVPEDVLAVQAASNTAVMVRRADGVEGWRAELADERRNAVVIGPAAGIGEETLQRMQDSLAAGKACVFDADALRSAAKRRDALFEAIARSGRSVVLTPHAGEFKTLFSSEAESIPSEGKLAAARAAARRSGAIIVLKGADTVIAAPDGRAAINENATPHLSTAGSGDVLAGIVGGLLAQTMPGFEAACAAVYLHSEAGRRFGPGLIAEDLPDALPGVLRDLPSVVQMASPAGR